MSDALEHEVKIIIDVVSNITRITRDIESMNESLGNHSGIDRSAAAISKQTDRLKDLVKAGKEASDVLGGGKVDTKGWDALTGKIKDLDKAYVDAQRNAILLGEKSPDFSRFASDRGVTSADLGNYNRGASVADASKQAADYQKALNQAASAYSTPRSGSFMAQGQTADLKASQMFLGVQSEVNSKMAEARRALAEYDAGLNSNAVSYKASTSALAQHYAQLAETEAILPRMRYALYDVARSSAVISASIAGVGVASAVAFAKMESSFTNVERTLDGVSSGGQVDKLRQDLIQLTREIPLTFDSITQIATLGNQLGISAQDIAKFTETTAKFSAVTGMTAEASAQAFGSLGELLNVGARDYEALGSSIALVGRKSVATEPEIVAMTQRLAASATRAGFTAQQVIALSGAFSSLRIAPERAQGVMETYFNRLNTAISTGGKSLEAFSAVSGVATGDIEKMVRTDPVGFFEKLAVSLGRMDSIAQTGALKSLGLDGLRAGEVFGRVSGNVDVFNKALADANNGWTQGTELGSQYGKVVDDLASKWQIFLNAVMEAGAGVGKVLAPLLGGVLSFLTTIAQGIAAIANNPVGAWLIGIAVTIGAVVAGIAGLVSVVALGTAGLAAMSTVIGEMSVVSGAGAIGLRTLSGAAVAVGEAMGFSAGMIRAFKIALISTGIGALVALLGALAAGIYGAATASSDLDASLQPVVDSLQRAIQTDTTTFLKTGEHIATATQKLSDNAVQTDKSGQATRDYLKIQDDAGASVADTTAKIDEQTVALGKNADAVLRQNLSKNPGVQAVANDADLQAKAQQVGFSIDKMITAALQQSNGASQYLEQLFLKMATLRQQATAASAGGDQAAASNFNTQALAIQTLIDKLGPAAAEMDQLRGAALEAGNTASYLGIATDDAGSGMEQLGSSAADAFQALSDVEQAAFNTEDRLYSLGSSLGENAGMWSLYSDEGRKNLTALYAVMDSIAAETPGNAQAIAANFQALYNTLLAGGYATADQLDVLRAKIAFFAGDKAVTAASRNFSSLFQGVQVGSQRAADALGSMGGAASKAADKVVTLIDYANDLSGVFKRAFDIRFGSEQGLDTIASGWNKISDASSKAADDMAKYRQELADLSADRAVKEYWLTVAEGYGDTLRAGQLRADLADISNKQADANKNLSKAQDKASMTLVGNTDAAIENRSTLLGLVSNYSDLLKSYAASGMSQDDLRAKADQLQAEFVQQATQLGFNRGEVMKYAAAFSDFSKIIAQVPRNVTVDIGVSGVDAATQALREFKARAQAELNGGGGIKIPISTVADTSGQANTLIATRDMYQGQLNALYASLGGNSNLQTGRLERAIMEIESKLRGMGYSSGGYTGSGGMYDIAGPVHRGEFVFSKAATSAIGVNQLTQMHNAAKSGKAFAPAGLAAPSAGSGMLELSPYDRSLLMEIADRVGLSITEGSLQAAVNGGNANFAQRRGA